MSLDNYDQDHTTIYMIVSIQRLNYIMNPMQMSILDILTKNSNVGTIGLDKCITSK